MKICTKCQEEYTIDNFYKDKSKNDGYHTICKICSKVKKKEYYENNKNICKERVLKRYWNNREHVIQQNREYSRKWYKNNKEHHKNNSKKRYYSNNNLELYRIKSQKRRARKLNQLGYLPYNYLEIMKDRDTHCKYCNLHIKTYGYHVDHIIPLSKGGLHDLDNLQLICAECNLKKGYSIEEDFIKRFK